MDKNKKILIISIVAVAVVFGVVGYFVGKNKTAVVETAEETSIPTPPVPEEPTGSVTASASTSASVVADATANWKTYTNDTYGFSFKYPSKYTLTDSLKLDTSSVPAKKVEIKNADSSVLMDLYVNPDGFGPFFPDLKYEMTLTDGKIVSVKTPQTDENSKDNATLVMGNLTVNSNSYLMFYKVNGSDSEPVTEFDQLLSTFQFIPTQ